MIYSHGQDISPAAMEAADDCFVMPFGPDKAIIRRTNLAHIIDLRHRILRADKPREVALYPQDHSPEAHHFAAFVNDRTVCCATFFPEPFEQQPAWRLRGMATEDGFRGNGFGRAVLQFAERKLPLPQTPKLLWCYARLVALGFYKSLGWQVGSEEFDIPTVGPHHIMTKRIEPQ